MPNYPKFTVRPYGLFRWEIVSDYHDGVLRPVCRPFFRWITAARICGSFTMHVRNGFDIGAGQND